MSRATPADEATASIFDGVARDVRRRNRRVVVEFYPYSSMKSLARERDGYVHVRLSDALRGAPSEVMEAIAHILLCRGGRRDMSSYRRVYRDYVNGPEMRELERGLRRGRCRPHEHAPLGRVYDLQERFDAINADFFGGELPPLRLAWSGRPARRTWGFYDHSLELIVVNRRLDGEAVPGFVVDYILYHEMLHARHEIAYRDGRRRVHTRDFRSEERAFPQYREAADFLKKLARQRV